MQQRSSKTKRQREMINMTNSLKISTKALLLLVLPALALTACTSLTMPLAERPPIPADLLALCPDLTPLETGSAKEVEQKLNDIAKHYYECADRHEGLVEAVKP